MEGERQRRSGDDEPVDSCGDVDLYPVGVVVGDGVDRLLNAGEVSLVVRIDDDGPHDGCCSAKLRCGREDKEEEEEEEKEEEERPLHGARTV